MNKFACLLSATVLFGFSACTTTSTVNVPLSYAKLDTGYVNSDFYDLGQVFVWDKTGQILYDEGHLNVPQDAEQVGGTVALQQASLSRDTEMNASADISQYVVNGSLHAAVARNTSTQLENVNRVTTDALGLVNLDNPITRDWRRKMASRYPGPGYEFFVVNQVISGSKLTVSSATSQGAAAGANIVQVAANVKVSVQYDSKNTYTEAAPPGQSVTLVIRGTLLRLDGSLTDPTFLSCPSADIKAFNLQHAISKLP